MDWSGVDYLWVIVMFYQLFGRHPFTAEDPLVSKWCSAKLWINKLIYILDELRVSTFSANLNRFDVTYCFFVIICEVYLQFINKNSFTTPIFYQSFCQICLDLFRNVCRLCSKHRWVALPSAIYIGSWILICHDLKRSSWPAAPVTVTHAPDN